MEKPNPYPAFRNISKKLTIQWLDTNRETRERVKKKALRCLEAETLAEKAHAATTLIKLIDFFCDQLDRHVRADDNHTEEYYNLMEENERLKTMTYN